ncbi:MAG: hypothetical protein RLZZ324_967, partial [Candidatus Parcubacteria bacterium]
MLKVGSCPVKRDTIRYATNMQPETVDEKPIRLIRKTARGRR